MVKPILQNAREVLWRNQPSLIPVTVLQPVQKRSEIRIQSNNNT